jgi:hypothetical protein
LKPFHSFISFAVEPSGIVDFISFTYDKRSLSAIFVPKSAKMYPYDSKVWIWIKEMFFRITLNKITTIFFLFSFLHCFAHGIVQSLLFTVDADASSLVSTIIEVAEVPTGHFAWLTRPDEHFLLRLCDAVPVGKPVSPCHDIFDSRRGKLVVPPGFKRSPQDTALADPAVSDIISSTNTLESTSGRFSQENLFSTGSGDIFLQPIVNSSGTVTAVNFAFAESNADPVTFDEVCTRTLVYAQQVLENARREELALIASEFWLLGLSVFAIMYDSIPHLLAGLGMRFLSTGWSAYSIWRTQNIEIRFRVLITEGTCGVNLFPTYFRERIAFQIPDLLLNLLALGLSCFLVWKLVRAYTKYMFRRVGAPGQLISLYRIFLGVLTCLQLSVYLLVASTALWIDQLVNGAIAKISSFTTIYLGLFIFTVIVIIPWIAMGWYAVLREKKRSMAAFLFIGFVFIVCWSLMYYSQVYRWTWVQWPFFASLTVAAQLVLIASIALGVICWRNFHKGLAGYLYIDSRLQSSDFEPEVFPHKPDLEKQKHAPLDFDKHGRHMEPEPEPEPAPAPVPSPLPAARAPSPAAAPAPAPEPVLVSPPAVFVVPILGKNDPWAKRKKRRQSSEFTQDTRDAFRDVGL